MLQITSVLKNNAGDNAISYKISLAFQDNPSVIKQPCTLQKTADVTK